MPLYLKPREVKVLDRVGPPYVAVKMENGGYNHAIDDVKKVA